MSTAKARSKVRLVRSENKWGRSNKRHFARQNHRKKTSDQYEKKFKNVQLSQFRADKLDSMSEVVIQEVKDGIVYSAHGWDIANESLLNNGESYQDRLGWAITIQNIQSDLGLQRMHSQI